MNKPDIEFKAFDKIPRLVRHCLITEKIDGTNGQVYIPEDLSAVYAGSRNRWLTPEEDNYGFASWVERNKEDLIKLGPGHHYGEWFGVGIQRNYGLFERRFYLFNSGRWSNPRSGRPDCCGVVPVLYAGLFSTNAVDDCMAKLEQTGSIAVPGFMKPEGVVVYLNAANKLYKKTIGNDGNKDAK